MKENKIASVVLNTIASIFTWTAFGLGISSVTSTAWYYLGSNIKAGLWQVCVNDICSGIPGKLEQKKLIVKNNFPNKIFSL